ncbi:MAG: YfiR family protein [Fibrobacteria bacterium]
MAILTSPLAAIRSGAPGRNVWALLFAFFLVQSPVAAPPLLKEYQVKAVFLFNFTQFTDWPAGTFGGRDSALVIGILGSDPFGPVLDEVVSGERFQDRPIAIKRYARTEDISGCRILFIGGIDPGEAKKAFVHCKKHRILSVGESEKFAGAGGMIQFLTQHGRIRLRIDMEPVRAAGLSLSSKLLRLAEVLSATKD